MIYAYPKLSRYDFGYFRFLGAGLGNLLFPWARASIFCKLHGGQLIAPTWPQIKINTFFRQDTDKRLYSDIFHNKVDSINGLKKIYLLASLRHVPEPETDASAPEDSAKSYIIDYSGNKSFFSDILGHHAYLFPELLAMTNAAHLSGFDHDFSNSVSIHIRRGDFPVFADPNDYRKGAGNRRIPDEWYIAFIRAILKARPDITNIHIFSDGTDEELKDILAEPKVARMGFGSSIADILALSQANILVASGSTFSTWASFLGQCPTIWPTGQFKYALHPDHPDFDFQYDYNDEELSGYLEQPFTKEWQPSRPPSFR
jgi:hypothetical protein